MRKLFTLRTLYSVVFCLLMTGISAAYAAVGDAGISAIVSPSNPVCKGTENVTADIKNYGAITISTATVNWRVNGVLQTPFSYTGTITAGNTTSVTIGSYNFISGSYTIKVWTTDPNGSSDSNPANDTSTVVINVSSALTGTYTVGGATPDYANFSAAVNALVANGVCGPVIFNIRAGTDTMQKIIPQIAGADSTNNITFKSQSGDSTSVVLTFPSQDTLINNYLIALDGADFINFRSLTLQRTGVKANGRLIDFTNVATNNTVSNCRLIGVVTTLPNSLAALLYSSNTSVYNDSSNTFSNNLFLNGSLGVYMNGESSLNPESYNKINNNTFTDQYVRGIQMTNQGHTIIRENVFTTASTYSGYAAIYLDRSLRPHQILKNKISGVPGTGIYLVDCIAQSGVHGIIANNFIHTNDSAGISMVNGDYQDIVFNSILMTGTTSTFSALLMRGSGTGKVVKNNILANTGGGYCYVVSDSAVFGISASNNNDLFTTGSFIGNYNGTPQNTLAAWRTASSKDSNSVNFNPNFATISDLHCTSIAMDDRGKPTSGITDDIDGQTRSTLTPDIGADEYSSVSRNVGVTAIINPVDSTCGATVVSVKVIVSNPGGFPESNFNVVAKITGAITTTLTQNHSATINPGTSDTITFSTTINTSAGGVFNFKAYTSLSVDDVHANDTLLATINIFPPPTPPVGTNKSMCGAGRDTLTATSSDSIRWYSASIGGNPLGYGPSFITPFINSTTTYYAASVSACEGSRTPVTLTVLPLPSINLGNDTSINQGAQVTLNAGAGFSSYLWSTTQVTQTINVNSTGCYWARVTNGSGCSSRDTICVNVIQAFDAGVTQITSPANLDCAGDTVQVLVKVKNLGANAASGIPVTIQITGAVTATLSNTITSTMAPGSEVILNMGTINTSGGGVLNIKAHTSYVNDLDHNNDTLASTATIILQPASPSGIGGSRCGAGTLVLISSSSDSVYWYNAASGGNLVFVGDNYVLPNLQSSVTYYAQSGQYCNNQKRTAISGVINQLPAVFLGNDVTVVDSLVLNAGSYISYQWSNNSTAQTLTVYSSNAYSVCVTDSNGCSNCDTINVSIIVGIEQIANNALVNLFPNPAHSSVTVEMKNPFTGNVSFIITNMQGQIVWNEESKNISSKLIDVSSFARGIYNLQIRSDDGFSVYRLIIE